MKEALPDLCSRIEEGEGLNEQDRGKILAALLPLPEALRGNERNGDH
jgi:hypothetical protein